MKINELKVGASNVTLRATVSQKDDPREVVTKYGKRISVANVVLKDETGTIPMSLWEKDIDTVSVGDVVEITNGYVNEFRGSPQLSTGRFGKITVVEKSSGSSDEKSDSAEDASDEESGSDYGSEEE